MELGPPKLLLPPERVDEANECELAALDMLASSGAELPSSGNLNSTAPSSSENRDMTTSSPSPSWSNSIWGSDALIDANALPWLPSLVAGEAARADVPLSVLLMPRFACAPSAASPEENASCLGGRDLLSPPSSRLLLLAVAAMVPSCLPTSKVPVIVCQKLHWLAGRGFEADRGPSGL